MKEESLQRTPMNSAEEPVKLLSDLVDHVLFIARGQACSFIFSTCIFIFYFSSEILAKSSYSVNPRNH